MLEILIPVGLLGGGLLALVKSTPATPAASTEQPEFPSETKALFLDTATIDGTSVQTFKPDMASTILRSLANCAIEEGSVENAKPGRLLFRLVPSKGDCSATQAALQAQSNGFLVLGSLSLALETTTADQLLAFVQPNDRALASSNFAVLLEALEAQSSSSSSSSSKSAPASRFDDAMPVEIVREIESVLQAEDVPVEVLRTIADDLEASTMPIGAAAVRRRADALELQRRIASRRALPPAPAVAHPSPAAVEDLAEPIGELETCKTAELEHELEAGKTSGELEVGKTGELELELEANKTADVELEAQHSELEQAGAGLASAGEDVELEAFVDAESPAAPVLSLVSSTPELERVDVSPRKRSLRPRTAL